MKKIHDNDIIPDYLTQYLVESYIYRITVRSKAIYWIIICFVIISLISLPFLYVDVSVRANGYFQTSVEKQTIYIPSQGKVSFSVIKEGRKVIKGDTLLIIDTESLATRLSSLKKQIEENKSSIHDLEILTRTNATWIKAAILTTDRYRSAHSFFLKQVNVQTYKTKKAKAEYDREDFLFKQNTISRVEHENSLYAYNLEKETLAQLQLQQKSLWQTDLTQRKADSSEYEAEYRECIDGINNHIVRAPLDGEIIESADIQPGTIVSVNQEVAKISPDGDLVATCFITTKDIGFLREKQDVRIQVDAFNYHEWGILPGRITKISDDIIVDNTSTAYFMVECRPLRDYLSLKNGFKGYIKKGMSLNARILVTRRSLYNLLFDKADKWLNPYSNT